MVEEPNVLFYESDAQLLRCLEDRLVVLAATWSGDILGSRLGSAVDIVGEWELATLLIFVGLTLCTENTYESVG